MLNLEEIRYGDKLIMVSAVTHAALMTNSPFIYLESQDFKEFTSELQASNPDIDCTIHSGKYCVSYDKTCDQFYPSMKTLEFVIDGTTYIIPPEAYARSDNDKGYACFIYVSLHY